MATTQHQPAPTIEPATIPQYRSRPDPRNLGGRRAADGGPGVAGRAATGHRPARADGAAACADPDLAGRPDLAVHPRRGDGVPGAGDAALVSREGRAVAARAAQPENRPPRRTAVAHR